VAESRGDDGLVRDIINLDHRTPEELAQSDDWIHAARLWLGSGDHDRLEALCERRRDGDPDDPEPRLMLARLRLAREQVRDLDDLISPEEAVGDSLLLLGLVRAARARRDTVAASARLDLLKGRHHGSAAIPLEEDRIARLDRELKARDEAREKGITVTALLGVSFCGSTALGSVLGSLPGIAHVGESHRLIKSSISDTQGFSNTLFDFDDDDPADLTPCHQCGVRCELFSRDFRRDLQTNPENWYFKLAQTAGVSHLVTGDKQMTLEVDPLERFNAVILFKQPANAFRSNLKHLREKPDMPRPIDNPEGYGNVYARNYCRFLDVVEPQGRKICLNWESFSAKPERHLKRLCEMLDLPFDANVLTHRNADQHAFGGSRAVRAGFRAEPESFSVRKEAPGDLDTEYQDKIQKNGAMKSVFNRMMDPYCRDFGE